MILNFEDLDVDFMNNYFRYDKGNKSKEGKEIMNEVDEEYRNEQTDKKKIGIEYIEDRLRKDEEKYMKNR